MEMSEPSDAVPQNARPYARAPHSAGGRRARQEYTCEHCGRDFRAKPVHDERGISPRRFCSKRCAGAHWIAEAMASNLVAPKRAKVSRERSVPERPSELINMSLTQPLTPGQTAKVRSYIFGLLRAQIPCAHQVVIGEVIWSPTQARVFATLLDKCVPDLSASFVQHEHPRSDISALSREELEALASSGDRGV